MCLSMERSTNVHQFEVIWKSVYTETFKEINEAHVPAHQVCGSIELDTYRLCDPHSYTLILTVGVYLAGLHGSGDCQ